MVIFFQTICLKSRTHSFLTEEETVENYIEASRKVSRKRGETTFRKGIGLTDEGHQGCPLHRLTTQLVAYTQKDAVQQERTMYKPIQGTGQ